MFHSSFRGVYAALLTPRTDSGALDETAFCRLLEFQAKRGIRHLALNGATGEFCISTPREVERLCTLVREYSGQETRFVCGAGAPSLPQARTLLQVAADEGAQAALLPTPFFFPYEQDDVSAWFRVLAEETPLPLLLYNLPQFTTGIDIETALTLLRQGGNIAGVKDSSGSTGLLEAITRENLPAARIVGNDGALIAARRGGFCDAVISGVACVLPELVSAVFQNPHHDETCRELGEVLSALAPLPTPWGLKWMAESYGIFKATFAQPLTERRRAQGEAFTAKAFQLSRNS